MYSGFAAVYDTLQADVPYIQWVDYAIERIRALCPDAQHVLELACGTGTVAIEMAKRGYAVEALDASEEMLAAAQHKSRLEHLRIPFYHGDMRALYTGKRYDVVLSFCDGFNYLLTSDALISTFRGIYSHLRDGGVLLFDVSTVYKFQEIIGDRTIAEALDDTAFIWENAYDASKRELDFLLTIFERRGAVYHRHEEHHRQRAYSVSQWIEAASEYFQCIDVVDGIHFGAPEATSERLCFIMKKRVLEA